MCILFACIGALGYIPSDIGNFDIAVQKLYAFCDLSSSWNAVIAFAFITLSICGGLKNRFTKKNKIEVTNKSKLFIPCAVVAIIIISLCIFFELFAPIYNLVAMIIELNKTTGGAVIPDHTRIGTILLVVVLFIYIVLMFLPLPWDYKNQRGPGVKWRRYYGETTVPLIKSERSTRYVEK